MEFQDFQLDETLLRAVQKEGYTHPTPVQEQAIPVAINQRDVLGTAQTGTGKTVAFLLPTIQHIARKKHSKYPLAVVLAPTRELALQISEQAQSLARYSDIRTVAVYGGAPIRRQTEQLRKGAALVIATPGRLLDHIRRKNIRLDKVEILILDEADRMLDMGFLPDIDTIIDRIPQDRQTMLFSATMPQTILSLSRTFMRDPVRVEVATARPPESIHQQLYPVPKHLKLALLIQLLSGEDVERALVFTRTKQDADVVTRKLREVGISVNAIHGDFAQKKRLKALEYFRSGDIRVLVATNVAARGLDIEGITHVINYDAPEEAENYVHRIGRTARVEAEGVAWTLVTPEDEPLIHSIEYLLGSEIYRAYYPGFDYEIPPPDWAKASAKTLLKNASRSQTSISRWKSLTR